MKCELKICEYGPSWNNDGETSVCSDRGICNPSTGSCECFSGYYDDNCGVNDCKNSCNGHGICVTDEEYYTNHVKKVKNDGSGVYTIDASGITSKYMERRKQCICESGYSGSDCSTSIYLLYYINRGMSIWSTRNRYYEKKLLWRYNTNIIR